jgi:DNA-binding winged helix-turn-helix (wHTH) protein
MASLGTPPSLIRFGPFALDPANRELRKRGHLIRLRPQPLAVLLLLAERPGQIVSREEIHQHIWGNDTFVDFDHGINFSINQIRGALGDNADEPRYVETISRRGYRFIAQIENGEPEPAASLASISADSKSATDSDHNHANASSSGQAASNPNSSRPKLF